MLVGLGHVALDRAFGDLQAFSDFRVAQAFQLAPEKRPSHRSRQAIEQFVQGLQGFQEDPALLGDGTQSSGSSAKALR